MAITIELPHVGESVVEGIIGKWLKAPGDKVQRYDPLVEVVTDKVTMEVPSPVEGVLTRILAEEGVTVPMGAPIAEMETDEEAPEAPARPAVPEPDAGVVGTTGYLVKDGRPVGPTGGGVEEPEPEPPVEVGERGDRARYSPAVQRLAREHEVDLSLVVGTGAGGRITRNDVLKHIEAGGTAAPAARPASGETSGQDVVVALTPVRRLIAQNMVRSSTEVPSAWSVVEADVTGLVKHRESVKEEFRRREGFDITYLPFAIKALVESLKEHPILNSTWGGDRILVKVRIHVGIAVGAADGLVVPVIHDADSLSIAGLAKAASGLTARARDGKLTLEDVQGGTFTLNNTGALGSILSRAIINHPQAAILTIEAIKKRPVVVEGDAIAVRSMMNLCLSFDHRILDGAQAGAFLQAVKSRLEAIGPTTPIY